MGLDYLIGFSLLTWDQQLYFYSYVLVAMNAIGIFPRNKMFRHLDRLFKVRHKTQHSNEESRLIPIDRFDIDTV